MKLIFNSKILKTVVSISVVIMIIVTMFSGSIVSAEYRPGATNRNIMNPQDDPVYYYQGPVDDEGNMDYYYYPIYGDPNLISDEEFFGEWDEDYDEWVVLPMFKYSEFPAMAAIEDAVKEGNYPKAKEEFWKYYNSVKYERNGRLTSMSDSGRRTAEQYFEAIARNTFPYKDNACEQMDIVPVNNEWVRYSVDATDDLKTAKGNYEEFSVYFTSIDKYYTKGFIYSRESDYAPVLRATVNGINMEFPALKDAVIRGGSMSKTNFGTGEILEIEEHGCYDDSVKSYNSYDETTARALITFDISAISSTDSVKNAYIDFTAKTDAPRGLKEINVVWYKNYNWTEEDVNWDTFNDQQWFSCNDMEAWDYVTKKTPGTKGKIAPYLRDGLPARMAQYYAAYGDERYAYHYIRHIMALINGIGYSPDGMNSLDMSVSTTSWISGIFYTMESEYMTPEIFVAIMKEMILFCRFQLEEFYGTDTNNWATYATGSVYKFISCYPEFYLRDKWFEATKEDNNRVMGGGTFEDGMCIESSQAYCSAILGTYSSFVSISKTTGNELPFDEELVQDAYDTVMTLLNCRGPYCGFGIGDATDQYHGGSSTITNNVKTWYNYGYFNNPHMEYIATNGARGALPVNPTTTYPISMRTYMRSGWGVNDLMLSFTNNFEQILSHAHADVLSITCFAYGKYLLTDQGYGSVQTGDYWPYNQSALQHNVVTVNNDEDWLNYGTVKSSNLERGTGINVAFEANMQYDFQEYATELFTTTQISQRSVTFVRDDNFWIVTDYHVPTNPETDNLFTQNWHIYPGANFTYDENYVIRSNFDDVNIIVAPIEDEEIDELRRVKTLYSEAANNFMNGEKAMLYKTKKGTGRFTTILVPENVDEEMSVKTLSFDTGLDPDLVNAACFSITNNRNHTNNTYYFYHLNDETKKAEAKIGDFATDATTLLIKKDDNDNIVSVFMMNGTYIKDSTLPGGYLVKSDVVIPSMSFKISEININIASNTLTEEDMESISIYTNKINEAYFAPTGTTLESSKKGGYIYFGDKPIVEVEEDEITDGSSDKPAEDSGDRNQGVISKPSGGGGGGGSASVVKPIPDNKETEDNKNNENQVVEPSVSTNVIPSNIAKELDGHWGEAEITSLYKAGIVTGDDKGLRLKDSISRAEFTALIVRALNLKVSDYNNTFIDVDSKDWYSPYIATAYSAGLVGGSDGMFRPEDTITREEICKIIACATDAEFELKQADFKDADSISSWAKEYINKVYSLGIVNGMDDGTFAPKNNALREQAFVILERFMNVIS